MNNYQDHYTIENHQVLDNCWYEQTSMYTEEERDFITKSFIELRTAERTFSPEEDTDYELYERGALQQFMLNCTKDLESAAHQLRESYESECRKQAEEEADDWYLEDIIIHLDKNSPAWRVSFE